jgi:hypothetical protein
MSPERQAHSYDLGEGVWAMGIVGYELIFREPPWMTAVNIFHSNAAQTRFNLLYDQAIRQLSSAGPVGDILKQMLRHEFAVVVRGEVGFAAARGY